MGSDAEAGIATSVPRAIQLISGFMVSQAVHVAAKLRVFDVLRDGPKTVRQVAERTETHEPSLGRLLRMLTAVDMLVEDEDGRFAATPLGGLFRSDHPQSVRSLAVMYGEPFFW